MATSIFRKLVDPFGVTGGDSLFGYKGYASKKGGSNGYDYQPYSGLRPPRVDTADTSILRPTQKQLFDILMARSKGQDVGYAPEWLTQNTELIKSNIGKQQEDQVREARGSLSAAGLSGNPRAIEATTGRINRDAGRSLSDSMTQLSIADLERKNLERDINTGRLQTFNSQNFAQENNAANFDLDVYNAEQGNRMGAAQFNTGNERYSQNRSDDQFNDLVGTGLTLADLYATSQGVPPGTVSASANALRSSGTGVSPVNSSAGMYSQPLNYKSRRALTR